VPASQYVYTNPVFRRSSNPIISRHSERRWKSGKYIVFTKLRSIPSLAIDFISMMGLSCSKIRIPIEFLMKIWYNSCEIDS